MFWTNLKLIKFVLCFCVLHFFFFFFGFVFPCANVSLRAMDDHLDLDGCNILWRNPIHVWNASIELPFL